MGGRAFSWSAASKSTTVEVDYNRTDNSCTPDATFPGFPKVREVLRRRGTVNQQAGTERCTGDPEELLLATWWRSKTTGVDER